MSNHNVNAKEMLHAMKLAKDAFGDMLENPIVQDFIVLHPTQFIRSVEKHTSTPIREAARKKATRMVNLILEDCGSGPGKISTIKMVRAITGLDLREAKQAVESGKFKMYSTTTLAKISGEDSVPCPFTNEKMTEETALKLLDAMKKLWKGRINVPFPSIRMVPAE